MAGDWVILDNIIKYVGEDLKEVFYVSNDYLDFINFSFVCNSDYLQVQKINKIEKAMGRQKFT